ncbi:MAG: type III pantothenate kinase [Xanthomonadales bacterium]|jgi:type III pantothenate kinase|nr:type III pantothenate kinase [Xanthomonadales bacterium]
MLLIDQGNTRTKFGRVHQGRVELLAVVPTRDAAGAVATLPLDLAPAAAPIGCGERSEPHQIHAAAGVSSAGPARDALTTALAARGIATRWIVSQHAGGLRLSYREPARLGADRYAAMRGAWAEVGDAVVVIDAGTAITIDALDACGQQVAALLLPGFGLQRAALARGTAAVRPTATRRLQLAARDTDGAVDAGLWTAVLGALDRVVAAVQPRLVLATGGDAPLLVRRWQGPVPIRHRPKLVLSGVWRAASDA